MTVAQADAIIIMGAGAVGSYVGGMLSLAGEDVILLDVWPAHVEAIAAEGLIIESPEGIATATPRALDLSEAQRLRRQRPKIAFLCVKLYDTNWAAALLADLVSQAPLVSMQNALVEETVARMAGWTRTLGAIAGALDVALVGPGRVRRSRRRGATAPVFKVGELSGRATPRARFIAELLAKVDTAGVTTNLWEDRWAKLCANALSSGVSGVSGLTLMEVYRREDTRRVAIQLGAEACAVGCALGCQLSSLFGLSPDKWSSAAQGDPTALAEVMRALADQTANMVEGGQSGTLQDLLKGRRTEVDYFNGYIAAQARASGLAAPTHEAIAALVRRMEAGEARPGIEHLRILAQLRS